MTDDDKRDELVGPVYDGLPPEAPPAGIDAAVLAAARDSVAPPRRRNWAVPVSLAAVLVLSVAVTLRMESERPDVGTIQAPPPASPQVQPVQPVQPAQPAPPARAPSQEQPAAQATPPVQATPPAAAAQAPPIAPKAAMRAKREPLRREDQAKQEAVVPNEDRAKVQPAPRPEPARQVESAPTPAESAGPAAAPQLATPAAPPSAPAAAASADLQERSAARAEQAPAGATAKSDAPEAGLAANAQLSPDAWLERIAAMRTEGRDIEAEVNIAEFRRRYPKFNIPPAMRDRIAKQR